MDHYEGLSDYMEGLLEASKNDLPEFSTWGDWCSNQSRAIATPKTGPPMSGFNYIQALDAMSEMAEVIGNSTDA